MKRPSLNWGSGIRQEAADLHRDIESHGTEKPTMIPLPPLSPRSMVPRVLPEQPRLDCALRALQGNHAHGGKLPRGSIHPASELPPSIGHPNGHALPLTHDLFLVQRSGKLIPKRSPSPSISFRPANTHAIGKDNLGFYALYSPAFLLALNLPLPCLILTRALGHEPPENEQRHRRRRRHLLPDLRISPGCHALQPPPPKGHRG